VKGYQIWDWYYLGYGDFPNTISPGLGSIKLEIVEVLKDNFIRKLTLMSL
jgi:hypothetical protein